MKTRKKHVAEKATNEPAALKVPAPIQSRAVAHGEFRKLTWRPGNAYALAIPNSVVTLLGVTKGQQFYVTVRDGNIVARPMNQEELF